MLFEYEMLLRVIQKEDKLELCTIDLKVAVECNISLVILR